MTSQNVRYRWIDALADVTPEQRDEMQRLSVSIVESALLTLSREMDHTKAPNYICQTFVDGSDCGGFEMTIRRWSGVSPLDKIKALAEEVATLKRELARRGSATAKKRKR
jgi:hypothetical protein